jgi:hypothetical protein
MKQPSKQLIALLMLAACGPNETFPDRDRYVPPDIDPLACVPNLDGRIDASELTAAIGIPVDYLLSPAGTTRPVNVTGQLNAAGQLLFDYSADDGTDQLATIMAVDVTDAWFRDSFPTATFAAPADVGGTTLGVYMEDDRALHLLGLASREPDPPEGRTLLVYTTPVALYRFPIEPGEEHVGVGETSGGTLRGLPYAGRDIYEVRVDAVGIVALPDLTFEQAHRVRTRVTVEPAVGAGTSRQQASFFFECFGEVARFVSLPDEPAEDFTTASETRRLSLR